MVAALHNNMYLLKYSHLCFNVGLPPSFPCREKQYLDCYQSTIMIKGAICRIKNCPAIQLCYSALISSRTNWASPLLYSPHSWVPHILCLSMEHSLHHLCSFHCYQILQMTGNQMLASKTKSVSSGEETALP